MRYYARHSSDVKYKVDSCNLVARVHPQPVLKDNCVVTYMHPRALHRSDGVLVKVNRRSSKIRDFRGDIVTVPNTHVWLDPHYYVPIERELTRAEYHKVARQLQKRIKELSK